jgi:hydroxymethylpyrimidine pyrophosphatase-like HAD family hydrolase
MADLPLVSQAPERLRDIRVVYTDLDGTMLGARASFLHGPDGRPTLEPAQALVDALEADIDVVPASGRALRGLITDGRMLNLPTVIAEMGAQISYRFGQEVLENFGETPAPGPPARVMERLGIVDLVLGEFAGRLELHLPWAKWRECTALFRGRVDTEEVDAMLDRAGHGWATLHDNGRLGGVHDDGVSRAYHLQPRGVTKGKAVALDQQRRGLAPEACIAIGDAVADLELAAEVAALILVRQAVEEDPVLAARAATLDNVLVTDRPQNLGWADTLALVARG